MPTYGTGNGGVGTNSIRTTQFVAPPAKPATRTGIVTPGPVTWGTAATDTMTASNGTSIDARPADSGQLWTLSGGSLTITSNAATNASGHGFAPLGELAIGHAYPSALKVSVAYTNVTVSTVGVGSNYSSTTYGGDYPFVIRVATNGTISATGAGADDLGLTGTLTGQPTSGTLTVECVGTTIRILIDGVQVAGATLPGTLIGSKAFLQLENAGPTADNLLVEASASELRTAVTSSRSTTWDVKQSVTSTRASTWNVAAAVTSSRSTTWRVLAAVAATRATTWRVLSAITSSRATTWHVLAAVTSTRATTWRVLAAVTSTRATTWDVAATASVTSTRATTWRVLASVTGTRAATWNVLTTTTSSRATTWRVLAAVTTTRATTWKVAGAVTSSRSTTWDVRVAVTSTRSTTWHVFVTATSTRATTWRVLAAVTSTRATTWNVAASPVGPFTITGDLGTLVGADFPTPAPRHVVVRLDLAGGIRDEALPTTAVDADGTFTLTGIPSSLGGARYRLSAQWRTGIVGVPVQEIRIDPLAVLADADLLDLV